MKHILASILILSASPLVLNAQDSSLKDAFKNDFLVGAAVNEKEFGGDDSMRSVEIIKQQFNTISPENALKWMYVEPSPGQFDFSDADKYVDFGVRNHMFVIGHNLVWHSQTPIQVFQHDDGTPLTRDELIARMHKHIATVVGRYKGKIGGWDVVNEALNEDGTLRNSPWRKIIGDDYLVLAFQFAHEADPDAQLNYNDYSLDNPAKRAGAVKLIQNLQQHGIKVYGVGLQEHDKMDWPSTNLLDDTINDFAKLGVKVMVTELDIDVLPSGSRSNGADVSMRAAANPKLNPYASGLPDDMQKKLAQRYADLFAVLVAHRGEVTRVTLWGVTDGDSWLNNWPIPGRTSYPLLFDRDGNPKPAYYAVLKTASIGK